MIKAVIFNLEGVLIDTPFFNKSEERQLMREPGLSFDDEMFLNLYGDQNLDTIDEIENQGGISDLDQATSIHYDYNPDYFDNIEIYEDSMEFLETIAGKYKLALVSETRNSFVSAAMEKYQLTDYFDIVITSDSLELAKPDSEIYLAAVKSLEVNNDEVLVIEYAPYGITAAKEASLRTVAVANKYTEGELSEADIVVESLSGFDVALIE